MIRSVTAPATSSVRADVSTSWTIVQLPNMQGPLYLSARRETPSTIDAETWSNRVIRMPDILGSRGIRYSPTTGIITFGKINSYRITAQLCWEASTPEFYTFGLFNAVTGEQVGPLAEALPPNMKTGNISSGLLDIIFTPVEFGKYHLKMSRAVSAPVTSRIRADTGTYMNIVTMNDSPSFLSVGRKTDQQLTKSKTWANQFIDMNGSFLAKKGDIDYWGSGLRLKGGRTYRITAQLGLGETTPEMYEIALFEQRMVEEAIQIEGERVESWLKSIKNELNVMFRQLGGNVGVEPWLNNIQEKLDEFPHQKRYDAGVKSYLKTIQVDPREQILPSKMTTCSTSTGVIDMIVSPSVDTVYYLKTIPFEKVNQSCVIRADVGTIMNVVELPPDAEYISMRRSADQTVLLQQKWNSRQIAMNVTEQSSGGIVYDQEHGSFSFKGSKRASELYQVTAKLGWSSSVPRHYKFGWFNLDTDEQIGPLAESLSPADETSNASCGVLDVVFKPESNARYGLKMASDVTAGHVSKIRADVGTHVNIIQL